MTTTVLDLLESSLPEKRKIPLSTRCKDITDIRYDKLVALYPTDIKKNDGSIFWVCKCDCGHYTLRTPADLKRTTTGHHCGNPIHHKQDVELITEQRRNELNGKIFNNLKVIKFDHIDGNRIYLECECLACGSKCVVRKDSILNGHATSCGCIRSKMEEQVKKYLNKNHISFLDEYIFPDMECPKGNPLRMDFYLPQYNLCIECQGRQHYESIEFFGGEERFIKQQNYDIIKEKYCKNKNIHLFIINYMENIEERLKEVFSGLQCTKC